MSPKEVFDLPVSLVQELLMVHQEIESLKADKIKESMSKGN